MSTKHTKGGRGKKNRSRPGKRRGGDKADIWRMQNETRKQSKNQVGIPKEMDRILHFANMGTVKGAAVNVSSPFALNSNNPNGGNGPAEFNNYATLYDFYRPVACRMKLTFTNAETFPIVVGYCMTTENPGTSTPYDQLAAERIGATKTILVDRATFSRSIKFADIVGSNAVETADSYRAVINTTPADTVWLTLGVFSPTSVNLTNGGAYQLDLFIKIRFYNADLSLQMTPPTLNQKWLDSIVEHRTIHRQLIKQISEATDPELRILLQKKLDVFLASPLPLLRQ